MELLTPDVGWDSFSECGFDARIAAESCRFAYSDTCDGNTDEAVLRRITVFRRLHNASHLLLEQYGYNQLWAVLPLHVAMFIKHYCYVPVVQAAGIQLNEEHGKLFDEYPGYWREGHPGLYRTGYPTTVELFLTHDPNARVNSEVSNESDT
ncbi:hypothetical protein [Stieleria varia]|nr:hypothetical protein [Stieleria varia]